MTQQKPHIAIVEDDSDQLHSIEEFLLDSGYSVWGAESAEAFYKGFTVRPVDVVILDLGLPGEDGLSLAQNLQTDCTPRHLSRDAVAQGLRIIDGKAADGEDYVARPEFTVVVKFAFAKQIVKIEGGHSNTTAF